MPLSMCVEKATISKMTLRFFSTLGITKIFGKNFIKLLTPLPHLLLFLGKS